MRIQRLFAVLACISTQAQTAAPVHLAPSGPWIVNYAEDSCRLIRSFGEGKQLTKLELESPAPGATDMLVIGEPVRTLNDKVPARFLPVQSKPMLGEPNETADKHEPGVLWSTVRLLPDDFIDILKKRAKERGLREGVRPPANTLAELADVKTRRQAFATQISEIEIDARSNSPVILDTGSLGGPITVFDKCSRDSLRDWGVDPDVEDKIVRPLWALKPWLWIRPADYPDYLARAGQESVVKVRVLVDAAGRVTKCTSLSHFKEAEFNKITCDGIMARARFEPAELEDGTKVPSYYIQTFHFRIER